jgi:hypothetical protein
LHMLHSFSLYYLSQYYLQFICIKILSPRPLLKHDILTCLRGARDEAYIKSKYMRNLPPLYLPAQKR